MSTRCGLRLREIAANTPVLHQLPVSVRHPGTISHGVGRALSCPPHRNQSMRRATEVWRATNPSMRGQNHSVSCVYLCTIETLAGEWPNRRRGKGLLRVEAAYEIRLGEWQEAPSRDLVRVVLRADRRKLSAGTHHPLVRVAGADRAKSIIAGPEGKLCCARVTLAGRLERVYLFIFSVASALDRTRHQHS